MAERSIFKIFRIAEWHAFAETGRFAGSADDKRDGFVHFSYAAQVPGTIERHFARDEEIVLAQFDESVFGPSLKMERSRDETPFPHVYAVVTKEGLRAWALLRRGPRGFNLPDWCGGAQ
jgi:uncharacterized protein (DUF952 family)